MANIIPYDDSPVVDEKALAAEHTKLVEKLKESLFVGQAGFIKSGQFLSEIRKNKTYLSEDSSREVTWGEFLSRPDIPLSGTTPGSRERIARKLMTVWESIASQKDIDKKELAEIGYTKLALVAGAINKNPDTKLADWLDKARELSTEDLQKEVGSGGMTIEETNACKHEECEHIEGWKCKKCRSFLDKDPNAKSKK